MPKPGTSNPFAAIARSLFIDGECANPVDVARANDLVSRACLGVALLTFVMIIARCIVPVCAYLAVSL